MKKIKSFGKTLLAGLTMCLISICLFSCGSLDQWAQGLQAVSDGLMGTNYTSSVYSSYSSQASATVSSSNKEWHDCSSCSGSGRCKYCGGSGRDSYTKNGKCGVCRSTGKCAGCNGKGGWYI